MKNEKMNSGKSKSEAFPNGRRRKVNGEVLAPKSARRNGAIFLIECTEKEIERAEIEKQIKEVINIK